MGNSPLKPNYFALPLTYGRISDRQIMQQYHDANNPPYKWPKIMHQMWIGENATKKVLLGRNSCLAFNEAEFKMPFWNQTTIAGDLGAKFMQDFPMWVGESVWKLSDVARLLLLYKYGGIYMDADQQCLRPLSELLLERMRLFVKTPSSIH